MASTDGQETGELPLGAVENNSPATTEQVAEIESASDDQAPPRRASAAKKRAATKRAPRRRAASPVTTPGAESADSSPRADLESDAHGGADDPTAGPASEPPAVSEGSGAGGVGGTGRGTGRRRARSAPASGARRGSTTGDADPNTVAESDHDRDADSAQIAQVTIVEGGPGELPSSTVAAGAAQRQSEPAPATFGLLFQAPEPQVLVRPARGRGRVQEGDPNLDGARTGGPDEASSSRIERAADSEDRTLDRDAEEDDDSTGATDSDGTRRRRRRGGKGRRRAGVDSDSEENGVDAGGSGEPAPETDGAPSTTNGSGSTETAELEDEQAAAGRKRTRRRRRSGSATEAEDPPGTVTRVRQPRTDRDEATGIKGSTRLEAKRQRRREGREAGRRRTVITEAEFLARRESVERVMLVRQTSGRTQIAVLEDGVLVEHYVARDDTASLSMAGNVYLGRVQNVLPSMEAAFVDIGKGRNAVLYAGEVNWDAAGLEQSKSRRIENALSSGQSVLVQVTKDPIGHKGARLTSQVSLPGRYLVYVPEGNMTGISRKLPETERNRLKRVLKDIVPDNAGVIVRTAAEGASEAELTADVERLTRIWEGIQKKSGSANAPALLHGEPDLTVRVVRDVFNEDFTSLIVAGEQAWVTVSGYVASVAPDLVARSSRWTSEEDLFSHYRIDEQLAKALDRKVWLPSGGSLVIDRTEAMTVVDVNTGKFVGSGGNLEETVTKNNIEAAEEIVRQLRLRDIGGIIVIDFIDMVLESNRELVIRRLLECLGRDRTKHQVAEVTSLGLVQMTRKRVGAGLLEVFSEPCEQCNGRGILVHGEPVDRASSPESSSGGQRSGRGRRNRSGSSNSTGTTMAPSTEAGTGSVGHNSTGADESNEESVGESDRSVAGPTPAQMAAAAYAAAVQASGQGDQPIAEFGADLLAADQGSAPGQFSVPGSGGSADPSSDAFDPRTESTASTGLAEPIEPIVVPRRKRGRVVAPAGPPRPGAAEPVNEPDDENEHTHTASPASVSVPLDSVEPGSAEPDSLEPKSVESAPDESGPEADGGDLGAAETVQ